MSWEEISGLCQSELEKLEARLPPLATFFSGSPNIAESLLKYEEETTETVGRAVREFAMTGVWPKLNPIEELMLSFRLDFAAMTASLLNQQPFPWTDTETETPEQKENRLGWLMLFSWYQEGFPRLQKMLQRLLSVG